MDVSVAMWIVLGVLGALLVAGIVVVAVLLGPRRKAADDGLAAWAERLDREQAAVAAREAAVAAREQELRASQAEVAESRAKVSAEREQLAGFTVAEAKAEVLARAADEARGEARALAHAVETDALREAEERARHIVVTAIQRLAPELTADSTVVIVSLPNEEMKGRVIGREGRNIRTFEQVTGVNVMIDDTPGSVLMSCFDPVRLEQARMAMADLVADGRIHPARIEQAYERAVRTFGDQCLRDAEDAILAAGILGLDDGLLPTIGALRHRTSFGQNVLAHSVESARLAALMAAELGCDVELSRRAAFLHDIGKALTGESEQSHAAAGAALLRRHGEPDDVVHAVKGHHDEVEPRTVEAVLVQAADAISGSRPGARRESIEAYVQRLSQLEAIAADQPGVERVFAMQAGREVRVMVVPAQVDDAQAAVLASEIAKRVHDELTYPGTIKVTVVRESRATALAK